MSEQDLCTQYQFIVAMLEKGYADEVVTILKGAIRRLGENDTADEN